MVLFIILGSVVFIAFVVLGVLFFMLGKEGQKNEEEKAVPLTDLEQLRKEMSSKLFEQKDDRVIEKDSEIIPVFTPKMPEGPTLSMLESSFQKPEEVKRSSLEDEAYKKRARDLEDELLAISKKAAGQTVEAQQLIESLTKENESLKAQQVNLAQAQQKLVELQGEASNLKTENQGLQAQLETTNAKVGFLEEQMTAFQIKMGDEISRANAVVEDLTKEKEILLSASKPEPDEAIRQELESLKLEQLELKRKYVDLEEAHQKLSELNAQLVQKNDSLQYELIKARAQTSGLERVSFNYKNQLEELLKQSR